jgi:hypothetical protein
MEARKHYIPEEHEDEMSQTPPSSMDDLQPGVRIRSVEFELRRELI